MSIIRKSDARSLWSAVFIGSPFSAQNEDEKLRNEQYVRDIFRYCVENDTIPFIPHALYPQFLDDGEIEDRALGMNMGLNIGREIGEAWFFVDYGVSNGMLEEINYFNESGVTVKLFKIYEDAR